MNTEWGLSQFLISILAVCALFTGCAGSKNTQPGPYVKPGLVMVPADQMKYYRIGSEADPMNDSPPSCPAIGTRSVQTDSEVTAIQFNRYADPARPNELMHEAHIVYRRDTGPSWKLTGPSSQQQILIGPQMTDGRGEIKGLVAPELDAYLREQRKTLRRQEETISKINDALRQVADQQRQFAEQLSRSDNARRETTSSTDAVQKAVPSTVPEAQSQPLAREQISLPDKETSSIPER
ncbi:MAG TPA: hypothetical protein VIM69_00380 [Opitutaceae bacterium]